MYELADDLGHPAAADRWKRQLVEVYPGSQAALGLLTMDAIGEADEQALAKLERLWASDPGVSMGLAEVAFLLAARDADAATIRRWADRWLYVAPWQKTTIALVLADDPSTRQRGIELLREVVDDLEAAGPEGRGLGQTVAEQRFANQQELADATSALAGSYFESGQLDSARIWYRRLPWPGAPPEDLEFAAERLLELGDRAEAVLAYARAAAHPDQPHVDQLRISDRLGIEAEHFADQVQKARVELMIDTLDRSRYRTMPLDLIVTDSYGNRWTLGDLLNGRVGVLGFWSPIPAIETTVRHELEELRRSLSGPTVLVIGVSSQPPAEIDGLADHSIFIDRDATAARELQLLSTRTFFVVDPDGLIRYRNESGTEDVMLQVTALLAEQDLLARTN